MICMNLLTPRYSPKHLNYHSLVALDVRLWPGAMERVPLNSRKNVKCLHYFFSKSLSLYFLSMTNFSNTVFSLQCTQITRRTYQFWVSSVLSSIFEASPQKFLSLHRCRQKHSMLDSILLATLILLWTFSWQNIWHVLLSIGLPNQRG